MIAKYTVEIDNMSGAANWEYAKNLNGFTFEADGGVAAYTLPRSIMHDINYASRAGGAYLTADDVLIDDLRVYRESFAPGVGSIPQKIQTIVTATGKKLYGYFDKRIGEPEYDDTY